MGMCKIIIRNSVQHNDGEDERIKSGCMEVAGQNGAQHLVRAFFSEFLKSDILFNNNCEVFNKYILDARQLLILSMFERIKTQIMTRHYNKQQESLSELPGAFCPKIRKKVAKNAEWANMCYALPSGQGVF